MKLVSPGAVGFSKYFDVDEVVGYVMPRLPVIGFPIPQGARRFQVENRELKDVNGSPVGLSNEAVDTLMYFLSADDHVEIYANNEDYIITDALFSKGVDLKELPLNERLANVGILDALTIGSEADLRKADETGLIFPEGCDRILFKDSKSPYPTTYSSSQTAENWLLMYKPQAKLEDVTKQLTTVSEDQIIAMEMLGIDVSKNVVEPPHVEVTVYKAEEIPGEKRLVYGVVLRPDVVDGHLDIMTPNEVEKTAHFFMAVGGIMGYRHQTEVKAIPVESYIAPVSFALGEHQVLKGDWVVVSFVEDEELWDDIKRGAITGYSVGGQGFKRVIE